MALDGLLLGLVLFSRDFRVLELTGSLGDGSIGGGQTEGFGFIRADLSKFTNLSRRNLNKTQ